MKLSRPRLIALIALGTICAALSGIGIYGLIVGPRQPPPSHTAGPSTRPSTAPPAGSPSAIPATDDPKAFAEAAARAIFDWNTTAGPTRADIIEELLAVGDPSGLETAGLNQDLQGYLPTAPQWALLAQYDTQQQLTIDSATTPTTWAGIAADPDNAIPAGTTAITIIGTRTRTGGIDGAASSSDSPVAFTAFLRCAPEAGCALLRLSKLGSTLP